MTTRHRDLDGNAIVCLFSPALILFYVGGGSLAKDNTLQYVFLGLLAAPFIILGILYCYDSTTVPKNDETTDVESSSNNVLRSAFIDAGDELHKKSNNL